MQTLLRFYVIPNQKTISLVNDWRDDRNHFGVIIQEDNTTMTSKFIDYKDAEIFFYKTVCRQFIDQIIEADPTNLPRPRYEKGL